MIKKVEKTNILCNMRHINFLKLHDWIDINKLMWNSDIIDDYNSVFDINIVRNNLSNNPNDS